MHRVKVLRRCQWTGQITRHAADRARRLALAAPRHVHSLGERAAPPRTPASAERRPRPPALPPSITKYPARPDLGREKARHVGLRLLAGQLVGEDDAHPRKQQQEARRAAPLRSRAPLLNVASLRGTDHAHSSEGLEARGSRAGHRRAACSACACGAITSKKSRTSWMAPCSWAECVASSRYVSSRFSSLRRGRRHPVAHAPVLHRQPVDLESPPVLVRPTPERVRLLQARPMLYMALLIVFRMRWMLRLRRSPYHGA